MGKFRTQRQKLVSKKACDPAAPAEMMETDAMSSSSRVTSRMYSASTCGRSIMSKKVTIFDKLDIDEDLLSKDIVAAVKNQLDVTKNGDKDDEFDTRSFVTSKSLKGLRLKKKDIQKLKHEIWLKKVGTIENHLKEIKETKKRQKTPVTGDMKPLADALPVLDWINSSKIAKRKQEAKSRSVPKQNQLKKQMLEGVDFFQTVLNHPTFNADPFNTISGHLKCKMNSL